MAELTSANPKELYWKPQVVVFFALRLESYSPSLVTLLNLVNFYELQVAVEAAAPVLVMENMEIQL